MSYAMTGPGLGYFQDKRRISMDSTIGTILVAVITVLGGVISSLVTSRIQSRKAATEAAELIKTHQVESEQTLQRIALEQSEHAFGQMRSEIDRYRQEVDRLRSDNDRLTRLVDETNRTSIDRMRGLVEELEEERRGRRLAEARAVELLEELRQLRGQP